MCTIAVFTSLMSISFIFTIDVIISAFLFKYFFVNSTDCCLLNHFVVRLFIALVSHWFLISDCLDFCIHYAFFSTPSNFHITGTEYCQGIYSTPFSVDGLLCLLCLLWWFLLLQTWKIVILWEWSEWRQFK